MKWFPKTIAGLGVMIIFIFAFVPLLPALAAEVARAIFATVPWWVWMFILIGLLAYVVNKFRPHDPPGGSTFHHHHYH